jgi:hypothetical protein
VEDAKATMGIYRLHKNDWERESGMLSNIRAPEPIDLWNLDDKSTSIYKRKQLALRLGIDIKAEDDSSVCLLLFSSYRNYLYAYFLKQIGGGH